MELRGKIVLITGAAKRIGREIALTLASQGASIILHYNRSSREASRLKKEIEDLGEKAFTLQADFSAGKKSVSRTLVSFIHKIYRTVPRVDVLVNNAAIFYPTPAGRVREADWDDFMTVNLKVPFFLAQELGRRMVKQKSGKIINLADWTGVRPRPGYLAYCVAKAGLIAVTSGLAKAFAPHVQVNSVAPGPILPPAGELTKTAKKTIIHRTPLKRFGAPSDIAKAVRFLIEDGDFITGALLPVDGGNLIA